MDGPRKAKRCASGSAVEKPVERIGAARRTRGAPRGVAFGVDVSEGAFGSHELALDMRVVDVATGADVSEVLVQRVRAEPLSRCVAETPKTSNHTRHRRRPFFNEEKVLEVRAAGARRFCRRLRARRVNSNTQRRLARAALAFLTTRLEV